MGWRKVVEPIIFSCKVLLNTEYSPAPGVGASMDVDEATDGGPPIPEPVTDGPGEAGRG